MKKTLPAHPLPDRKNNFKIWVDQIRYKEPSKKMDQDRPMIKSIYIRKSIEKHKNWNNIQKSTVDKYIDKISLMEEIIERKVENTAINLIYSPRYAYPKISAGK